MHGSVVRWCITWSFAVSIRFWRICRSGRRDCWTLLNELMGSIIRTVCRHCWRPCLMIWVVVTSSWVICWFFMIKGRALCLGWEPAKQGDLCELLKKLDYFRSVHRCNYSRSHVVSWLCFALAHHHMRLCSTGAMFMGALPLRNQKVISSRGSEEGISPHLGLPELTTPEVWAGTTIIWLCGFTAWILGTTLCWSLANNGFL